MEQVRGKVEVRSSQGRGEGKTSKKVCGGVRARDGPSKGAGVWPMGGHKDSKRRKKGGRRRGKIARGPGDPQSKKKNKGG